MNKIEYIQNWCEKKESFSFFLPNGTEGRPFDNSYQVISVKEYEQVLVIKLSHNIEFILEGDFMLRDEFCNLIITILGQLTYKKNGVIKQYYTDGELCLSGF